MDRNFDYTREDIEKIAWDLILVLAKRGYFDLMFMDSETETYVSNKLECLYLQGRLQGREDCKQICNEVF